MRRSARRHGWRNSVGTDGARAVVAVGEGNDKELVAYFVPCTNNEEAAAAAAASVTEWEQVYEELFGRAPEGDFDTTGWDSSYDGRPIPPEHRHERRAEQREEQDVGAGVP